MVRSVNIIKMQILVLVPNAHTKQLSTQVILRKKDGNILFSNVLDTFHLRLYGVGHMVKDHSDSES